MRHGNADPIKKGGSDISRDLSKKGVSQAQKLNKKFKGITFDHIFCSPAQRAFQTLNNAVDGAWSPATWTCCWQLYGGDMQELEDMFAVHGYAPLSAYFSDHRSETLRSYAKNVAKIIEGTLGAALATDNMKNKSEVNVLIVGHAVSLNAIALYLFESESPFNEGQTQRTSCAEKVLGETEYMVLDIVQK